MEQDEALKGIKTYVVVDGMKHYYGDYPPPDGFNKLPTIVKTEKTKAEWLRFWEVEGVKDNKFGERFNSTTHYRCCGCDEIFVDRHGGTIILTGLHNLRMIGLEGQCISVIVLKNETSPLIEERRSPRFHSSLCFYDWVKRMIELADRKLADPQPEDLR